MTGRFLTAVWRDLAMLNYIVEPEVLHPLVPRGTTLDLWNGAAFVSVVGFMFDRTRLLGVPIPFHTRFEEVNLRFYVRRIEGNEVRRGVTFIKEIVPRRAIASVARMVYNEPYVRLPMRHRIHQLTDTSRQVEYGWRRGTDWMGVRVDAEGPPERPIEGSEARFIAEHYWGYTRQRDGSTIEYEVEHPAWRVWRTTAAALEGDVGSLYGEAFAETLRRKPSSAFLAEGSAIVVRRPRKLPE